ncbi:MAG: 1,4-alpha-glucan branching enzyme, partial [Kribbellaceae bacterium]|nr:1,4-alpha-glucan branching enzyme [Kribbellaceae bacterium]
MDSSERNATQSTPVRPESKPVPVDAGQLERLVSGTHHDPHQILGPHLGDGAVTLRVLRPFASTVTASYEDQRVELQHEYEGVWVGVLAVDKVPEYRLEVTYTDGPALEVDD